MQSSSLPVEPPPPVDARLAEALLARARSLEEIGDEPAALAALERAAEAPSHAGVALSESGRLRRRRGEREEALWAFKRALHHSEDRARVAWIYAELGHVYFSMREDEEAAYYFRRAASLERRYELLLERTSSDTRAHGVHVLDTAELDLVAIQ